MFKIQFLRKVFYLVTVCCMFINCKREATNDNNKSPVPIVIDSVEIAVNAQFENSCSGCHGQQIQAFADRKWKHGKEISDLMNSIKNGYSDSGMPSFDAAFSEEEIKNIAIYIRKGIDNVDKYKLEPETTKVIDTFKTESISIVLDTIVSDIRVPWHMNWLPNGNMLVTDRDGYLYRIDDDGGKNIVSGVPIVKNKNQGGLFEIQLHPNFKKNHWVYLSYSDLKVEGKDSLSTTVISRYKLENDQLTDKKDILKVLPYSKKGGHYGAKMLFDDKGYLFVTIGDRQNRDVNPQDLTKIPGKIHRIHDDGSIPSDNPFVDSIGAVKSIYSYGHRNPQGIAFHPKTKDLWEHEHGPRGGDELNIVKPATNYGWPVISYGLNYDGTTFTNLLEKEGMEQPIHYWTPSIAPSGMTFVTSDKYGDWENNLLVGSLRFKYLNRCVIEDNKVVKEEILFKNIGRLRNVAMGPDGYIYVSVEKPGYVFRLNPVQD